MANKDNPVKGKQFQHIICDLVSKEYKIDFNEEVPFPIGFPCKDHKFDCVSTDNHIVVECKCYSWTETNKSPSAKYATLNEAMFYFSFLPKDTVKILAMKKDINTKRNISLAQHYVNTNYEFLLDVKVLEYDENNGSYSWIYPINYLLVIEDKSEKAIIMYDEDTHKHILTTKKNGTIRKKEYQVIEDTVINIDKLLLKEGNIQFIDASIKPLIESLL